MTDMKRWVVPVGIAAVVATVVGFQQIAGAADPPDLPKRNAAQLLVDLQNPRADALSGTVVARADLGLPQLPGGAGSTEFGSLISGSHTMKVWYGGPDKVRLALLGTLGESDLIRNGKDVWLWSSREASALHSTLPADGKDGPGPLAELPKTPQEAADSLLAAVDPSTVVSTSSNLRVAGRAAYDLILAPRDRASLVGSVHIAVDGERHVPLRVQVFAKGSGDPAFEVGFTQISFDKPAEQNFKFTPPPGTTVKEESAAGLVEVPVLPRGEEPAVKGKGWTTVVVARTGAPEGEAAGPLAQLPKVQGAWGSGRLLTSKLFSALLTDDGRLLIGAVSPEKLYEAAQ